MQTHQNHNVISKMLLPFHSFCVRWIQRNESGYVKNNLYVLVLCVDCMLTSQILGCVKSARIIFPTLIYQGLLSE